MIACFALGITHCTTCILISVTPTLLAKVDRSLVPAGIASLVAPVGEAWRARKAVATLGVAQQTNLLLTVIALNLGWDGLAIKWKRLLARDDIARSWLVKTIRAILGTRDTGWSTCALCAGWAVLYTLSDAVRLVAGLALGIAETSTGRAHLLVRIALQLGWYRCAIKWQRLGARHDIAGGWWLETLGALLRARESHRSACTIVTWWAVLDALRCTVG